MYTPKMSISATESHNASEFRNENKDSLVKEGNVTLFVGTAKISSDSNVNDEDQHQQNKPSSFGGKLAWGGGGFYNPKMGLYRDIVMLIVIMNTKRKSVDASVKSFQDSQFRFLDAFSGCGALALRVAKVLEHVITEGNDNIEASVMANDASRKCRKLIRNNAKINSITSKDKDGFRRSKRAEDAINSLINTSSGPVTIDVTGKDVNQLLSEVANGGNDGVDDSENSDVSEDSSLIFNSKTSYQNQFEPFHHIHLDPFGCTVPYLDSAIRALKMKTGILTLTATDTGALFDRRYADVAKRHYNLVNLDKDRGICFREVGLRMIIASVAQAANRQDKGIEVLMSFSAEHFLFVCVRIRWDTKKSTNECLRMTTIPKNTPKKIISTVDVSLKHEGPLWMGRLGDKEFMHSMIEVFGSLCRNKSIFATSQKQIKKLLETLHYEYDFVEAAPWFYSLTRTASLLQLGNIPSTKHIIRELNGKMFRVDHQNTKNDITSPVVAVEDFEVELTQDKRHLPSNIYICRASPTHFEPQCIKIESLRLNKELHAIDGNNLVEADEINEFILRCVIEKLKKD